MVAYHCSLVKPGKASWRFPGIQDGIKHAYALGQIDKAARFVEHDLLTPDTNAAENVIRPFVVGRKNWLFSGNELGAHASAGIYSLNETAKANGHEPFRCLAHLFEHLPLCRSTEDRETLLPYRLLPSDYAEN